MMSQKRIAGILCLLLMLLYGVWGCCDTHVQDVRPTIPQELLNRYWMPLSATPHHDIRAVTCTEPDSVWACNMPCSFDSALMMLHRHRQTLPANRRVLELVYLADFVYATFSYEYLYGSNYPKKDLPYEQWNGMTLRQKYNLGNHNRSSLYCDYRMSFFLSLMDEFLPYRYFTVEAKGVHSYAVVDLGPAGSPLWVIADAYDPFVALDDEGHLLDIFTLWKTQTAQFYRTRRFFGPGRQLVAEAQVEHLAKPDFCGLLAYSDSLSGAYKAKTGYRIEQVQTFDLGHVHRLPAGLPYRYAVQDYGRPDDFRFDRFFHPDSSAYLRRGCTATVPARFRHDAEINRAVEAFNRLSGAVLP